MDLSVFFAGISAVAASISAFCSLCVVYIAFRALGSWKREHLGKFSFEVAYDLREALNALKRPLQDMHTSFSQPDAPMLDRMEAVESFLQHYTGDSPAVDKVRDYLGKKAAAHLTLMASKLSLLRHYVQSERNPARDSTHRDMLENTQKHRRILRNIASEYLGIEADIHTS